MKGSSLMVTETRLLLRVAFVAQLKDLNSLHSAPSPGPAVETSSTVDEGFRSRTLRGRVKAAERAYKCADSQR